MAPVHVAPGDETERDQVTDDSVDTRIFVVGVPRAGTTLVQSLLAGHRELTSFTESHLLSRHFRPVPRLAAAILLRDPLPRLREFLVENGVESGSRTGNELEARVRRSLSGKALRPLVSAAVAKELLAVLDVLARARGARGWVEKTPRHLRYVPFIERLLKDRQEPRFVHVIRDGLETVASLYMASRQWERAYDIDTCIERWNADVAFSLTRASLPNDHFVFYEDLTERPDTVVSDLVEAVGLAPDGGLVERYGESVESLVTETETWKANVADGVRRSGTSHRVLTAAQRERVEKRLRQDLYGRLRERVS